MADQFAAAMDRTSIACDAMHRLRAYHFDTCASSQREGVQLRSHNMVVVTLCVLSSARLAVTLYVPCLFVCLIRNVYFAVKQYRRVPWQASEASSPTEKCNTLHSLWSPCRNSDGA